MRTVLVVTYLPRDVQKHSAQESPTLTSAKQASSNLFSQCLTLRVSQANYAIN